MKRFLSLLLLLSLLSATLVGCVRMMDPPLNDADKPEDIPPEQVTSWSLNGVPLEEYAIIYADADPDYTERAAAYLGEQIKTRTGLQLSVSSDADQTTPLAHEIVVGESNRAISAALDAETEGSQFAFLANDAHIAMEGDYFVIAAAAYFFAEVYIGEKPIRAMLEKEARVYEPITKKANNHILLIGDGMGVNQTLLFEAFSAEELGLCSDGESAFYGYMFPHIGRARTNSLSGTTDSAAAGTALATGYKTKNGYVGKDADKNDVQSLTEIAIELRKSTAVMSTEVLTGATPAAFSAHAVSRNDTEDIKACQEQMTERHGTLILGNYGANYTEDTLKNKVEKDIQSTLEALSQDEDGFFMMYEEAYFDKHSHSNELENTFRAAVRFNQIIGCFMEFAFYHPDTVVIITADHETGGLTRGENGEFSYTTGDHTSADVPVFAYGHGTEVFDGVTVENVQIPKTIAKMWKVQIVGNDNENYPARVPAN